MAIVMSMYCIGNGQTAEKIQNWKIISTLEAR